MVGDEMDEESTLDSSEIKTYGPSDRMPPGMAIEITRGPAGWIGGYYTRYTVFRNGEIIMAAMIHDLH